jgi:hypothetical protein
MSKWGNQANSGSTPSHMKQGSGAFDLINEVVNDPISDKAKAKRKSKAKLQRQARKKRT